MAHARCVKDERCQLCIIIIIIIIIKYEKITMTLSQPNVAGALYKVNEDMPMSVDA